MRQDDLKTAFMPVENGATIRVEYMSNSKDVDVHRVILDTERRSDVFGHDGKATDPLYTTTKHMKLAGRTLVKLIEDKKTLSDRNLSDEELLVANAALKKLYDAHALKS